MVRNPVRFSHEEALVKRVLDLFFYDIGKKVMFIAVSVGPCQMPNLPHLINVSTVCQLGPRNDM